MNDLARYWQARAVNKDELGTRVVAFDPDWSVSHSDSTIRGEIRLYAAAAGRLSPCKLAVYGQHVEHPVYSGTCGYCGKEVIFK